MASVPTLAFQTTVPEQLVSGHFVHSKREPMQAVVRRRPTPQQGRSLEMLGHAIEYLIDSELSDGTPFSHACPSEAAQILMRLNREVFAECKQIVPLPVRIRQQIARLIERKNQPVQVPSAAAPRT